MSLLSPFHRGSESLNNWPKVTHLKNRWSGFELRQIWIHNPFSWVLRCFSKAKLFREGKKILLFLPHLWLHSLQGKKKNGQERFPEMGDWCRLMAETWVSKSGDSVVVNSRMCSSLWIHFPHLKNGSNDSVYVLELWWATEKAIYMADTEPLSAL